MTAEPTPLMAAAALLVLQAAGKPPVLLDCGYDLADPAAGERAYAEGHLPGAHYVHLERDLAGARSGGGGRHPLPGRDEFAARAGRWGVRPGATVVAYDAQGGPYAARAWWLLRWLGHRNVAVLDGGVAAWREAGGRLTADVPVSGVRPPYPAGDPAMPTIGADGVRAAIGRVRLFDARAGERFRGEAEPIDPVAGHIPGATSRFFKDNLQPGGGFKPAAQLRSEFEALGAGGGAEVVHQCGSGVTACHNLLAMAHAGFGDTVLYPGSWSEWCSDPKRPVARG